ncbi:hypothetical protein EB796_008713 [Bugula neritina]|uniref:Uncharacterized protein n=1 Tax=Bugula neritina TaxID=10212 RepID=A0A7J7K4W7_BUGNE|nr:hypothetical protein EB796_008713 [Bugula neritina]
MACCDSNSVLNVSVSVQEVPIPPFIQAKFARVLAFAAHVLSLLRIPLGSVYSETIPKSFIINYNKLV